MNEYEKLAQRGQLMLAALDRDLRYQFDVDLARELVSAVVVLGKISPLHEVATQRTVDLAAVIEKAKAVLASGCEDADGIAYAVLHGADAAAVLRDRDAAKWDEGALWAAVECAAIVDEWEPWLAPGDNPYRAARRVDGLRTELMVAEGESS
jgi:hypothetical protein